jgi:3-hydroxy-9,10-secoandrosta-1,3,5(10)-triene-9,17-dione monooxygenase reductase component
MRPDRIAEITYRHVMAHWATGVSVVTVDGPDGPEGCTANAVTSLSLEPPLILVCLELESHTLAALRRSRRFALNLLTSEQSDISNHFAVKAEIAGEKFAAVPHRIVEGAPVIDGALGWIVCELEEELPGGDHVIATGCPVAAEMDERLKPLIFFQRSYWEPAPLDSVRSGTAA